jgi:urocanate hydratase
LDGGENLPLALDHNESAAFDFALQVERLYAALIRTAGAPGLASETWDSEPSLGGKLLYAGELDRQGRALLVAGNIAGAASLAATADVAAQKQAVRDGVADFLVTSLDEALRILKNEIRKSQTVSVCVAASPHDIELQMLERGVLPDLLPPDFSRASRFSMSFGRGVRQIELVAPEDSRTLLAWHVASAPAQWLPKLDSIALGCLDPSDGAARRWLRLAPRYLGRLAQGVRVLYCEREASREFVARVQAGVRCGEIGVEVRISLNNNEEIFLSRPSPSDDSGSPG